MRPLRRTPLRLSCDVVGRGFEDNVSDRGSTEANYVEKAEQLTREKLAL